MVILLHGEWLDKGLGPDAATTQRAWLIRFRIVAIRHGYEEAGKSGGAGFINQSVLRSEYVPSRRDHNQLQKKKFLVPANPMRNLL